MRNIRRSVALALAAIMMMAMNMVSFAADTAPAETEAVESVTRSTNGESVLLDKVYFACDGKNTISSREPIPATALFPQSLGSGQYVYTLPRTSLAALRLDPCSPEENKAVTLTMSDITLNAADTLPAVWQYFVPTWYQAFCLVLYPALAAAAVSMVGAVVTERKRK